MTIQPENNNLYSSIDPTFTKVNRLFVLSFLRTAAGYHRDSISFYYTTNVRIKDLISKLMEKSFFDLPVNDEEETCKNVMSVLRNNDYTTGNLWISKKKKYKLTVIDLSK